jgi:Ca2+-binding EF-hand superfamily protein
MERREAEELMPPPPPVVVDVNKPMKMDESFAALLANGSTSLPGIPGMVGAAPAPSGDRSYVGLAVDPKTRGLVAVENDVTKKKHENHAAAAAAGVPLWITIENDVAWEWFKELDDDSSGELDMAEAKQLCVKLNLKVKNFANVFAELDTGGDGTVSFTEFVHWFNERKTAERREMRLQIRDLFQKIDKDKSGCLSKDEIKMLVKKSGKKLNLVDPPFNLEKDWEAMHKIGEERDVFGQITKEGEVTFSHFEDWWKDRSGIVDVSIPVLPEFMVLRIAEVGEREGRVERRRLPMEDVQKMPLQDLDRIDFGRMTFNDLYERVDTDVVVERRAKRCGVAMPTKNAEKGELSPELRALNMKLRKDVLDELALAAEVKEQKISVDSDRTGREIVIDLLIEQKGTPGVDYHRSGRELWAYLRPRLKFIVQLQTEWGSVHELYPSRGDSLFDEVPLPSGVRDPDSFSSGMWDLFGLLLLICVSVLVPLRSCFEVEVEPFSGAWFFDLFTDVYFVVDLFLNFFTAYYDDKGMREFRKSKIRWNYLRGWFVIDLVSCLPVGYVGMVTTAINGDSEEGGSSSNTRAFKALRLLRLAKMLRIAKVLKIFEKYAEALSTFAGVYIMVFLILFLAHIMCCFWYMIGNWEEVTPGIAAPIQGWVLQQEWDDLTLVPLWTKYATSLATVFAALENWNTGAPALPLTSI